MVMRLVSALLLGLLLSVPPFPARAGFTFVLGSSANGNASSNTVTLSGLTSIPVGSIIIVEADWAASSSTTDVSITDNGSGGTNTWTAIGGVIQQQNGTGAGGFDKYFACKVQFGSITSITGSITTNSNNFINLWIDTFTVSGGTAGTPTGNSNTQLAFSGSPSTPTLTGLASGSLTFASIQNTTGDLSITSVVNTGFSTALMPAGALPNQEWDGYSTTQTGNVSVSWNSNATENYISGIVNVPFTSNCTLAHSGLLLGGVGC